MLSLTSALLLTLSQSPHDFGFLATFALIPWLISTRYSGRVEAACKHVVAVRMKRSGMRWSKAGSQNVLSLRVAWLNKDWDRLWDAHPLARAA